MPDPILPALHIRPARGWLNDPNGVARVDGRYHVFFQYNPKEPVHGSICWGHVSSTDLLRWEPEPIALSPRPGTVDAAGCWSGSVVDDGGTPTAVYTAVPDHAWNAGVVLARSDRTLREWVADTEMVIGGPDDPTIAEVRDPFVFTFEGHRYAVQGAGHPQGRPQVLVYGCDELRDWVFLGPLLTDADPVAAEVAPAQIWECPNLVQIDGRWVLVVSLWRWVDGTNSLSGVRYLVGDLVRADKGLRFVAESGGSLDSGPAFYAPQATALSDRVLLWAWAWELGRSTEEITAAGWAGVLTFPRELTLRDGVVHCRPAAELTGLRTGRLDWLPGVPFRGSAFELVTDGAWSLGLAEPGESPALVLEGTGPARVLVDGSMVEAFAGPTAHTTRAYPTATSQWVVTADASSTVYRLGL